MIIVYPADGWNSFISVADAIAQLNAIDPLHRWEALTLEQQEAELVLSATILASVATVSTVCDFAMAQVMFLQANIESDGKYLSLKDVSTLYTSTEIGSIAVEYRDDAGKYVPIPPIVSSILRACMIDSSMPVTRGFTVA
jgi:hypothetical protein